MRLVWVFGVLCVERCIAFGRRVHQRVYLLGAFIRRVRMMCSWVCAVYVIRVWVGGKAKREKRKRETGSHWRWREV